jgi:hypothetical protein
LISLFLFSSISVLTIVQNPVSMGKMAGAAGKIPVWSHGSESVK